ncbi:heparinase II/III family protein [Jeotgalicoccus sp. S0W5]|uniref:heparinase II/III domain-containing protein n=1 Tax=Jeotgalicoccus sp. S0W5 TaxID=2527874 RepID=UPI001414F24C|nr:heparinase II/III family protein [Jeotgalicoccus sp. S0W5]
MNKYNINKRDSIEIGDSISNNSLVIKYKYIPKDINNKLDVLNFNESFDWNIELDKYTNMSMLHLHAWEPVNYLLLAYHYTNNDKYLIKCNELVVSWYSHSLKATHKYLYYSHCVADRSLILGYLQLINSKYINQDILNELIISHTEFLKDKSNYINYNHGSMIDRSLLVLSMVLQDNQSFNLALNRFRENIKNTFTTNMICKENSFTYAIFNLELIVSTQKILLDDLSTALIENFDDRINVALDFLDQVKKPDGSLPLYGDSELIDNTSLNNSILKSFYSDHSLFIPEVPEKKIKTYYYKYESYIIIKNSYLYLFIRTGDIVKNHKHADDLSISVYMGEDIIVDTGTYNYDKGPHREYFKSVSAHNGVELNNENYNYLKSNKNNVFIHSVHENDEYIHIVLVNNSYNYANITRNIYVLKDFHSLLISDYICSPIKVSSAQIFNLSKEFLHDLEINIQNRTININNKYQFTNLSNGNQKFSYNNKNLYSEKFQHAETIPKIEITNLNKYINQTTYIGQIHDSILLEKEVNEENIIYLNINKKRISLPFKKYTKEITVDQYINVYQEGSNHTIEIHYKPNTNQEYAIYVYDDENTIIDTIWYQPSNIFKYKFHSDGTYRIRCFVKDSLTGEKTEFSNFKNIKTSIR